MGADGRLWRISAIVGAIAMAASACGSSATPMPPSTTYEVWNYSVTIPDRLGLEPTIKDPRMTWVSGLSRPLLSEDESRGVGIQVDEQRVDPEVDDSEAARRFLERVREGLSSDTMTWSPVESVSAHQGAWQATMTVPVGDFTYVVFIDERRVVTMMFSGIDGADRDAIIASFALREPPGNPASPPAD